MTTAGKAQNAFAGEKTYQLRARRALPILVRQAKAREPITYGGLARELGMPNPRTLNFVLGSVGRTIENLAKETGTMIPALTALVVNSATKLPSEGVAEFLPDGRRFQVANPRERDIIARRVLDEVYLFGRWDYLLSRLNLAPAAAYVPPSEPIRGGGESEAHRNLKQRIAADPSLVGLSRRPVMRDTEFLLRSGDRLDVFFGYRERRIAVEVKTADANLSEISRGLFQCVKYKSLIDAELRVADEASVAEAILALGGALPESLVPAKNVLGILVIENLEASGSVRIASA